MVRPRQVFLSIEGAQGSGKDIILEKVIAYLEFFNIKAQQTEDEDTVRLVFTEQDLAALVFECPKCGVDISDSYEQDDPSVGIVGGWYCEACDIGFVDEREGSDDDR
jgi:hypothetical protein